MSFLILCNLVYFQVYFLWYEDCYSPGCSLEAADAEAETPVLWPPHAKSWLIGKDSDAGRDWGQEEEGTTEDDMAGWHHRLGCEFEWTPEVDDGQGGLVCCDSWGRKELDMTELLKWTELNWTDTSIVETLWDTEGQGSLVSCSPWDHKESNTTWQLNNNSKETPCRQWFFFSFSFDSKLSSKGSAYICSMTDSQLSRTKWHKYLLKPLLKTAYVVLIKITVFSLLLLTSHIMYSKRKLINYRKAKRNLASLKIFFSPKLCRSFCKASFSFFRFIELYKIPCM